jgi:hypothetical protein
MKAIRSQIAKIHIAKKQLGIDEESYRELLYNLGVRSSKDLTYSQANLLIEKFIKAGFKVVSKIKNVSASGKNKYSELDGRDKKMASSSKLRKIEAIWREISDLKTDDSLQKFIFNRVGISHIIFLSNKNANTILAALEAMSKSVKAKAKN